MSEQREEFVKLAGQADANVSELCRRFGVSRKTGYKWLGRFAQAGPEGLAERSRRPLNSPRRLASQYEEMVVELRARHPAWGARKLAHVLERDREVVLAPSTVNAVLRRHGLISAAASAAASSWQRFEHEMPNALWQMDFKGHFATDQGRCHPLTVLDDHSRFNLVLQALDNERRSSTQPVLQAAFERYGLPARINTDNGPPWGTQGQGSVTELGVWLIRLGVGLSHSRPAHPQTNGKEERFHRTIKAEVLAYRHFRDTAHAQRDFDDWRQVYNHQRPHEALDMHTPASRYAASMRSMPKVLPPIEYAPGDIVRKVQQGGWISLHGHAVRLSKALAGQPVALRCKHDHDGQFDVFFCHHKLDFIDLTELV